MTFPQWLVVCLAGLTGLCGCESILQPSPPSFGPTHVRIHPTFTQVKDWTGDGKPDGIEVVVELLDDMDEPVRAPGTMIFELYLYREDEPNGRGDRLFTPWVGSLLTREEQSAHWSPALRAYTFQLADPKVGTGQKYILSVTFDPVGEGPASATTHPAVAVAQAGPRLFDSIVIDPLRLKDSLKRRIRSVIPEKVSSSRG